MAEEPENLTLKYLRRMDEKLDRVLDDMHDLKLRVTNIEEGLSGVHRRMDRFDERLDKIEKRLDLVNG